MASSLFQGSCVHICPSQRKVWTQNHWHCEDELWLKLNFYRSHYGHQSCHKGSCKTYLQKRYSKNAKRKVLRKLYVYMIWLGHISVTVLAIVHNWLCYQRHKNRRCGMITLVGRLNLILLFMVSSVLMMVTSFFLLFKLSFLLVT